jgi:hypothetical protein
MANYKVNYNDIKWSPIRHAGPLKVRKSTNSPSVIADVKPFVSPIDGTVLTSRSEIREHEKRHQVRQCGNDWTGSEKPSWWDGRKDSICR